MKQIKMQMPILHHNLNKSILNYALRVFKTVLYKDI